MAADSDVIEVLGVGLGDEDLGQRLGAIVSSNHLYAEDLIAFLADRLVRYKTPRGFEFTPRDLHDDAGNIRSKVPLADRMSLPGAGL